MSPDPPYPRSPTEPTGEGDVMRTTPLSSRPPIITSQPPFPTKETPIRTNGEGVVCDLKFVTLPSDRENTVLDRGEGESEG